MQSEDSAPSIRHRRSASQNLTRLNIPRDVVDAPLPKLEDVEEEGRVLYTNFMMEQIRQEGIQQPTEVLHSCTPVTSSISTPDGYKYPAWAKAGRRLRYMADEFSKTKERERIRNEANQRDLQDLNQESFYDFLREFFNHGIPVTSDQILFLFFFCSDVAIRALRQKADDLFRNLYDWSIEFIVERVSAWVQHNGGWAAVLSNSVSYMKVALIGGMVMLVLFGVVKFFRGGGGSGTATS